MNTPFQRYDRVKNLFRLTFILTSAAAYSLASAGSIVEVTNISKQFSFTMSDLIVYGKNGEKKTIAALGNAADDIDIGPGGRRTFDAGFEVDRYFVSTQIDDDEFETRVLKVKQVGPKKLGWVQSVGGGSVIASLDYGTAAPPPPVDSFFDVFAGLSPSLPGWFFGTSADLDDGSVSNPFQGQVKVVSTDIEVATIPEPSSWAVLAAGLGLLVTLRWRRFLPAHARDGRSARRRRHES